MQKDIHPKYHEVTFNCNCGHQFKVNSTIEDNEVHLDICLALPPVLYRSAKNDRYCRPRRTLPSALRQKNR